MLKQEKRRYGYEKNIYTDNICRPCYSAWRLCVNSCAILEDINNAFNSIYGDAFIPDEDDFSIEDAINEITTSKMSSSVTITVDHYNRGAFGVLTNSATMLGSGSVIMISSGNDGSKLYVLTNAHCVESLHDYQYKSITMTDYHGNGSTIPVETVREYLAGFDIFAPIL